MHRFRGTSPYSSLAQSVEHLTVNQGVVGSSPTGGAKTKGYTSVCLFVFLPYFPMILLLSVGSLWVYIRRKNVYKIEK